VISRRGKFYTIYIDLILIGSLPNYVRYCLKIIKKTKRTLEEQLRVYDLEVFEAYLH
jgi:hypothetical protein